jgi:GAF domain-containing protein
VEHPRKKTCRLILLEAHIKFLWAVPLMQYEKESRKEHLAMTVKEITTSG